MADTLTLQIAPETAAELQRMAEQSGRSVEEMARVLLEEATAPGWGLSEEQLADLDERLANPGPYASEEEVDRVLGRFRPKA